MSKEEIGCLWKENPEDNGESWLTDCEKQVWDLDPTEEPFNFCPFCGKKFLQ